VVAYTRMPVSSIRRPGPYNTFLLLLQLLLGFVVWVWLVPMSAQWLSGAH
jgi:hypothetical protein